MTDVSVKILMCEVGQAVSEWPFSELALLNRIKDP